MTQRKTTRNTLFACMFILAVLFITGCQSVADTAHAGTESIVTVTAADRPEGATWLADIHFPYWKNYVDDTLAMNGMYSWKGYHGQGYIYVTVGESVESFRLFFNNTELDTSAMEAGRTYIVDLSALSVDGQNTIQASQIKGQDARIDIAVPYPTVLEGTLEEAGIDPAVFEAIDDIISHDVENGFTSAQLAVIKDGRLVYQNAWGNVNSYGKDGTPVTDGIPVTNETMYDLASNTKMYTVNYALQYLVSNGLVDLDSRIVDILGEEFVTDTISIDYAAYDRTDLETVREWKSGLTIRDVLRHQAGFPADPQFHNDAFDQTTQKPAPGVENVLFSGNDGSAETRENTLKAIFRTPLMYEPGTKTVYSDVDYMLLSFVVEKITGEAFDSFLDETFYSPMGLERTMFNPLRHGFEKNDCAATELNGNTRDGAISFTGVRTETLQGEVHDEKCYYAMGGVSGHAGLYSNATELAELASAMLTGGYGETRFFSQNVMDTFTAPKKEDAPNWGLGWWREADDKRVWYFGTQSSEDTIGHQGWTGTLTQIDPDQNLVIVYLTNKINSPVTDKEVNPHKFDGNWYTSSTLGFVGQLLYQGLDGNADAEEAMSAALNDMAHGKFALIDKETAKNGAALSPDHPIVRSGYALVEAVVDRAERSGNETDLLLAEDAKALLDPVRDALEIEKLSK